MKLDSWDALALTAVALIVGGIGVRWGWDLGAIAAGAQLLGLYALREVGLAKRRRG